MEQARVEPEIYSQGEVKIMAFPFTQDSKYSVGEVAANLRSIHSGTPFTMKLNPKFNSGIAYQPSEACKLPFKLASWTTESVDLMMTDNISEEEAKRIVLRKRFPLTIEVQDGVIIAPELNVICEGLGKIKIMKQQRIPTSQIFAEPIPSTSQASAQQNLAASAIEENFPVTSPTPVAEELANLCETQYKPLIGFARPPQNAVPGPSRAMLNLSPVAGTSKAAKAAAAADLRRMGGVMWGSSSIEENVPVTSPTPVAEEFANLSETQYKPRIGFARPPQNAVAGPSSAMLNLSPVAGTSKAVKADLRRMGGVMWGSSSGPSPNSPPVKRQKMQRGSSVKQPTSVELFTAADTIKNFFSSSLMDAFLIPGDRAAKNIPESDPDPSALLYSYKQFQKRTNLRETNTIKCGHYLFGEDKKMCNLFLYKSKNKFTGFQVPMSIRETASIVHSLVLTLVEALVDTSKQRLILDRKAAATLEGEAKEFAEKAADESYEQKLIMLGILDPLSEEEN